MWFKADSKSISLLSVIEALSGPVVMDTCQSQPRCATEKRRGFCDLKPVWNESSHKVREALGSSTLDQMMA